MIGHDPKHNTGHDVALWAGVAAFFGSLATIGAIEAINPGQLIKLSGSLVVAAITAGGVYSKQRLDDAKTTRDEQQRPTQPD
jgi:hypothetical protein